MLWGVDSVDMAMANFNSCHAEYIKMSRPLLTVSQSDYLIQIIDTNSHSE